ncbi:MAG: hypothetical protein IPK60_24460 [Sandaracinaceae bacterium]|nr:hypothetical protein [Sandaracinaceae bacterium]
MRTSLLLGLLSFIVACSADRTRFAAEDAQIGSDADIADAGLDGSAVTRDGSVMLDAAAIDAHTTSDASVMLDAAAIDADTTTDASVMLDADVSDAPSFDAEILDAHVAIDAHTVDGAVAPWSCSGGRVAPIQSGGRTPAVAFDASGYAHIAYIDPIDRVVSHAWRDASSWHTERLTTEPVATLYSTVQIVVDPSGNVHILYLAEGGDTVGFRRRHAVRNAGTWTVSAFEFANSSFMAIDPAGTVTVASATSASVDIHRLVSGVWSSEHIHSFTSGMSGGFVPRIAFDDEGHTFVAAPNSGSSVAVFENTGGTWSLNFVALTGSGSINFAVSPDGETMYLTRGFSMTSGFGAFWFSETVPHPERASDSVIFAIDDDGVPTLAYGYSTPLTVSSWAYHFDVVKRGATTWSIEDTFDFNPSITFLSTFDHELAPSAFDSAMRPVALTLPYERLTFPLDIYYTQYAPLQSTSRVTAKDNIDSTFYSAVDSAGHLRAAFAMDRDSYSPSYPNIQVAIEGVDGFEATTHGLTEGLLLGFAIGNDDRERVFASEGAPVLKTWNGSAWVEEVVAASTSGTIGNANSTDFVLADDDTPHGVWTEEAPSGVTTLRYATKVGGSWQVSTVATSSYEISGVRVVVAGDHAYVFYSLGTLDWPWYFARWNGTTWGSAALGDGRLVPVVDREERPCAVQSGVIDGGWKILLTCFDGAAFVSSTIDDTLTNQTILDVEVDADGYVVVITSQGGFDDAPRPTAMFRQTASGFTREGDIGNRSALQAHILGSELHIVSYDTVTDTIQRDACSR